MIQNTLKLLNARQNEPKGCSLLIRCFRDNAL